MYFDRIERSAVAVLLDSIYRSVKSLEDMQFLVQYASQLLPPDPAHATGEAVWYNILELQQELTTKREVGTVLDLCILKLLGCWIRYAYLSLGICYVFMFMSRTQSNHYQQLCVSCIPSNYRRL